MYKPEIEDDFTTVGYAKEIEDDMLSREEYIKKAKKEVDSEKYDSDSSNDCAEHPLLNPDSSHYAMADGVEAIQRLEQMYSKEELQNWANISAMKYRLRIGNKDDVAKEARKIKTFEDYYLYLEEKPSY